MNILIIGEYSGFAKNLKIGFEKLGHQVVCFQEGDGFKNINLGSNSYSYPYFKNIKIFNHEIKKTWIFRSPYYCVKFRNDIKHYSNIFDVALILNYDFIRLKKSFYYPKFTIEDVKKTLKPSGKIYLSACGDDYAYIKNLKNFRYSPTMDVYKNKYLKKSKLKLFEEVRSSVEGVIPIMYEYAYSYRNLEDKYKMKIFRTIALPLCIDKINFSNEIKDKIVIFHGLNRESKGTYYITKALDIIAQKYGDRVEVLVKGKLPLDDYLKLISRTNIIIDQCYGYSYAMNALYSMAMGKLVFSGNEPECRAEFQEEYIPVVNILPDVDDIVAKIEYFILNKDLITEYSVQSRRYVEKKHECMIIAKQYLELFKENLL